MTKKTIPSEIIYGINPLVELLKAGRRRVQAIYTSKPTPREWPKIEQLLPRYPVPIHHVSRDKLAHIAGTTDHQSVVAMVQPYPYRIKSFDKKKHPFLVMIDGVQDPRNLGAIIRSAYCTGADGVVLGKKNTASLTAAAIKASAGLAERIEIYQAPTSMSAAQELVHAGYQLYLATFDGDSAVTCTFEGPLCVVVGSEGSGITRSLLSLGKHITLQQRAADISYNASVAAGILLFLIGTQLKRI